VDIRRVYSLFMDLKRSTEYLRDHQKEYLFSEEEPANPGRIVPE
jgi:hypothetical protein